MAEAAPTASWLVRTATATPSVDQDFVVGDEAGDFSTMLNGPVAVAVHDLDAEAVMGSLAVFQFDFGEHLFVAVGLEDGLGRSGSHPRGRGRVRSMASSPAANTHPRPSLGATRRGRERWR